MIGGFQSCSLCTDEDELLTEPHNVQLRSLEILDVQSQRAHRATDEKKYVAENKIKTVRLNVSEKVLLLKETLWSKTDKGI